MFFLWYDKNMKKYYLVAIFLFAFVFLGATQIVYSETDAKLEELSSQQERLEQMKTLVNSFFFLAEKSEQQEAIESALNEAISRIDSIQERVENRIEERERRVRIMNKTDDWRELAEAFLEEPTLDNFDYFCKRSKEIDGPEKKEVLNDDRTEMIMVNATLYENFCWCKMYLEDDGYVFVEADINHQIEFLPSDNDKEREYKIKYNEEIEEIVQNYNFYAFHIVSDIGSNNPSLHLEKCLEQSEINFMGVLSFPPYLLNCKGFYKSFHFPEESVLNMIER